MRNLATIVLEKSELTSMSSVWSLLIIYTCNISHNNNIQQYWCLYVSTDLRCNIFYMFQCCCHGLYIYVSVSVLLCFHLSHDHGLPPLMTEGLEGVGGGFGRLCVGWNGSLDCLPRINDWWMAFRHAADTPRADWYHSDRLMSTQ